jgi:hypothetical protein
MTENEKFFYELPVVASMNKDQIAELAADIAKKFQEFQEPTAPIPAPKLRRRFWWHK